MKIGKHNHRTIVLIFVLLVFQSHAKHGFARANYTTEVLVSSGDSEYHFRVWFEETWTRGIEYNITMGTTVDTFGSSIQDFHDIQLQADIRYNNESISGILSSGGEKGVINEEGEFYGKLVLFTPDSHYQNSVDIYVSATFREAVNLFPDLYNEDKWIEVGSAKIIDLSTDDISMLTFIQFSVFIVLINLISRKVKST